MNGENAVFYRVLECFKINEQNADIGGVDTADARGLSDIEGADAIELFCRFEAQTAYGFIVDIGRQSKTLELLLPLHLGELAADVAVVLDADSGALPYRRG